MNEKLESLIKKLDDLETQKRQVREEIEKVNREINKKRRNMSKSRQDADDARNREIYELLKNGCTAQYLSEKYSLSVARIYGIKNDIEYKDSYNEKYPDFVGLSSHLQKIFTISKIKNKEDLIDRLSSDEGFDVGAFAHLGKITLQELEDFVEFDICITIVERKGMSGYIWKDRILKRKI